MDTLVLDVYATYVSRRVTRRLKFFEHVIHIYSLYTITFEKRGIQVMSSNSINAKEHTTHIVATKYITIVNIDY